MFGCFMGNIQSFVHAIVLEKTWLQYVASRNLFPIWTLQHVYKIIYIHILVDSNGNDDVYPQLFGMCIVDIRAEMLPGILNWVSGLENEWS